MPTDQNAGIPPGWVGGFAESNPAFAYPQPSPTNPNPHPDLSSLKILDNMDNIDLLQRQQKVIWPEFSWETEMGKPNPERCYQMFAPDISRLGYTNLGRVYSIICPQQGASSPNLGSMNVEVTVTGQRGWANETNRELAGDMSVEGKIWFSPSAKDRPLVRFLWRVFEGLGLHFPFNKANAIRVSTHNPGEPNQPIFPLLKGESTDFPIPDFAKHPEAWTVGHLGVQIGPIVKTGKPIVDDFNQLILDIFNTASGNMLQNGNVLTWNVWFTPPELVDTEEWKNHAILWRDSIDADHGSPDGPGTSARYFDGSTFKPVEEILEDENGKIRAFLETHSLPNIPSKTLLKLHEIFIAIYKFFTFWRK